MGDDRKGEAVTELTPRQILDAVDRALEKAARQFANEKTEESLRPSQSDQPATISTEQGSGTQRQR
jgi:hypothetical protein